VDDCQRSAIVGLGGVGKTQIALEAAFQIRDQHPGCSIFWVPAVNATSFDNAYRKIGRQLGVEGIDEDTADVKTLVREALSRESSGHWLLIIDNADDPDLLFSDMALSDCLPFSRKGSVLMTTRNHEAAMRLDIPFRNIVTTKEMDVDEATDLLLKDLNGQRCNLEDAKSLLGFLANLPLAIKQASAYIAKTGMPIAKYLEHCKSSDKTLIKLLSKDFEDRGRYRGIRNPVATTWLISFEHISRVSPLAARYLKFICFLAEKEIPVSLLPPASNQLEADEAIGILKAYGFITNRASHDSFDMHSLVRLATRNWLDEEGKLQECVTEVIQRLDQAGFHPQTDSNNTWIEYLPHIQAALESSAGSADEAVSSSLLQLVALCYHIRGQYQKSEQKMRQAMELVRRRWGEDNPHMLNCMTSLGQALVEQGKYDEAEGIFRQVMQVQEKVLGKDHPDTLGSMCELAGVLDGKGEDLEAESLCRQALELMKDVVGEEHPDHLRTMKTLSAVLISQGKYEEAEAMRRRTDELWEKVLGKEHPDTLSIMDTLFAVLSNQGEDEEAEATPWGPVELREKVLDKEPPDTLSRLSKLATILRIQGRREDAVALMERCYQCQVRKLGPDHHKTRSSLRALNDWKLEG
jgi:tetratricopeptide (TPR) repeat protein